MFYLFECLMRLFYPNTYTEMEQLVKALKAELTRVEQHRDVLQKRIDSWIASGERDKYRLIEHREHYTRQLERDINIKSKQLSWMDAECRTIYPNLWDRARKAINDFSHI